MSVLSIQFLRSETAHKRPYASGMLEGEIVLNINSESAGLFLKNDLGGLVKIGPVEVSTSAPNSSAAGQTGNSVGELWFDETSEVLKIWHGGEWKTVVQSPVGYTGSVTAGSDILTIVDGIITDVQPST